MRVWVLLADEAKLMDFAARRGCDFRICVRHGMPILWRRYRHRVGMWAGLLLFFAAIYTAPLFVWEINVEGLDRLSREYVCELLADEGVRIGAFSPAKGGRKRSARFHWRFPSRLEHIPVSVYGKGPQTV